MLKQNKLFIIMGTLLVLNLYITSVFAIDSDNDTILDETDNCINIANIEQFDNDNDGFGDMCAGDFNNSCLVDFPDYFTFVSGLGTGVQLIDLNSDGDINFEDYNIFFNLYG